MNDTYILLSRSLLDSDVFASQKLLKIWIWCLCKANYKARAVPLKTGKGERIVNVKRGEFIFGRHKAEEELFIDGSTIYKLIKKLEDMDMIMINSNNQYSIITICKYDTYQNPSNYKVASEEQPSSSQVTAKEQPSNTDKQVKNVNKDKNVLFKNANISIDDFKLKLRTPEFKRIDLDYYYRVIMDWSNSSGKIKKDWYAVARNWIRSDLGLNRARHIKQDVAK